MFPFLRPAIAMLPSKSTPLTKAPTVIVFKTLLLETFEKQIFPSLPPLMIYPSLYLRAEINPPLCTGNVPEQFLVSQMYMDPFVPPE